MASKEKAIKILLTGEPGVGKSTLVQKVVSQLNIPFGGIIAQEIRDQQNNRVGFEAVSFSGERQTFAHKTDIKSDLCVGGKYYVDHEAIENFVVPEISINFDDAGVLILDEIGRMQAFSQIFLNAVAQLLENQVAVLGTIVKDPEPWSIKFKEHQNTILVEVTLENRDEIVDALAAIYNHLNYFQALSATQKEVVCHLTKEYFEEEKYLLIKKLFCNALVYLAEGRVAQLELESDNGLGRFKVDGNHGLHLVECSDEEFSCDCNLYSGKDEYLGQAGECSHIQAVKLFQL